MKATGYLSTNNKRLQALSISLVFAFLVQMWISYGLWEPSQRLFPMVPVGGGLSSDWGATINQFLFYGFQCLLLLAVFPRLQNYVIPLIFVIFSFWVFQDVLRLQAWAYQYMLILALLFLGQLFPKKQDLAMQLMRFLLIGTYLWTGFYKINLHFVEQVYPWLIGIFPLTAPLEEDYWLGYAFAVFEMLLGLGLLWRRSRLLTCWLVTLFHLIILLLLVTDDWNHVVYAWNLFMIAAVWLLFGWPIERGAGAWWRRLWRWPASYAIVFLVGIAPALYPWGLWPHDLSFTMYSGLSTEGDLIIQQSTEGDAALPIHCIPLKALKESYPEEDYIVLTLDDWSLQTMNIPTYPAVWYYQSIKNQLCNCLDQPIGIEIIQKEAWSRKEKKQVSICEE